MQFPTDVVEYIAQMLDASSILALSQTNTRHAHLRNLEWLWVEVGKRDHPYVRSLPPCLDSCKKLAKLDGTIAVAVVGDRKTGKTTLVRRWLTGEYSLHYTPTTVPTLYTKVFNTIRGRVLMEIVDHPGGATLHGGYDVVVQMKDVRSAELLAIKYQVDSRSNTGLVSLFTAALQCKFFGVTFTMQDAMMPPVVF
jgi:hypothetical protein